jgi:hypothetical protein
MDPVHVSVVPLAISQLHIHLPFLGESPIGKGRQEVPRCSAIPFAIPWQGMCHDLP